MGQGHDHAPVDFGRAFAIGVGLNLAYVAVEAGYGLASGSLALVADAGHNLSDVLGLLLAWGAATLAKRAPSLRRTYGMRRSSILAALGNALLLMVAVGAIAWEAIQRLGRPEPVAANVVIIVAGIGIVINGATALLFAKGREGDINIKGAYLHMMADALVSVGVVIAGLGIRFTGYQWIDPVASLLVVVVILWGTWGLFRQSLDMALDAVPPGIDPSAVRNYLASLPGVQDVYDLHIWPMSTTEAALTAHLLCPDGVPADFFEQQRDALHDQFSIEHMTLQVEPTRTCDPCDA